MAKASDPTTERAGRLDPHLIVLFGATGDLTRRKLLPGFLHLMDAGLLPELQIVASALEDLDEHAYRAFARQAVEEFARPSAVAAHWDEFATRLSYVPQPAGAHALGEAAARAEAALGPNARRLHYLSIPPKAAPSVVEMLDKAGLVDRARIVLEKPFGTDLRSARRLNAI
ncbi:MAG: glucose-6-phosphate dehydrogenase, partial [Acidimicrobiales bacterium]